MNCTHCKYFKLFPIVEDGCQHGDRDQFPEVSPAWDASQCPGFEEAEDV